MQNKKKWGGKRTGAGRKSSGTDWKTVSFRIKEEWREPIKIVVRAEIKRQKLKNDIKCGVGKNNI